MKIQFYITEDQDAVGSCTILPRMPVRDYEV